MVFCGIGIKQRNRTKKEENKRKEEINSNIVVYSNEKHLKKHPGKGKIYKTKEERGVAQLGSAPALGAGCRRFKSCHPDQKTSYTVRCSSFFIHSGGFEPQGGFCVKRNSPVDCFLAKRCVVRYQKAKPLGGQADKTRSGCILSPRPKLHSARRVLWSFLIVLQDGLMDSCSQSRFYH